MIKQEVPYDQSLLSTLEKKYQMFLDSPNGEINIYLILEKNNSCFGLNEENQNSHLSLSPNHGFNFGNFN